MKLIIKLLIVALVANAAWRIGSAYLSYYRFKDAVTEAAQFGRAKNDEQLRARVMELAQEYDIPLAENAVSVSRDINHTTIDASFERTIDVVPGYKRPFPFTMHVDVIVFDR